MVQVVSLAEPQAQGCAVRIHVWDTLWELHAKHCIRAQVSEAERLFQEVLCHYGRIDIAVNATGRHFKKPIIETKSIEWEEARRWLASHPYTSPVPMAPSVAR